MLTNVDLVKLSSCLIFIIDHYFPSNRSKMKNHETILAGIRTKTSNSAVNFINIYALVFLTKFWRQSLNVTRKAAKKDVRTKNACEKMLMKQTADVQEIILFVFSTCLFSIQLICGKYSETHFSSILFSNTHFRSF